MENTAIVTELEETKAALLDALAQFSQEQVDVIPFEGSWTAGQVAEHILKSASGALETINGAVVEADRNPEMMIGMLKDTFLNFDIKMTSPDFVLPTQEQHDKKELLQQLGNTFGGIIKVATNEDLMLLCTDFSFPTVGYLTRTEFIHFAIYHTQRHTRQLKNVYQAL